MDFRRLLLALSLSFIFIFVWQTIFVPQPLAESQNIDEVEKPEINQPKLEIDLNSEVVSKGDLPLVDLSDKLNITTDLLSLGFVNGGSSLSNIKIIENDISKQNDFKHVGSWDKSLGAYSDTPVTLMNGQECNPCLIENGELVMFDFDYVYEYNNQTSTHTITSISSSGLEKTTIVNDTSYVIDHIFSSLNVTKKYDLIWGGGLEPSERSIQEDLTWLSVFAEKDKSYSEETITEEGEVFAYSNVGWAGIKTKYFIKAITNQQHAANKTEKVYFESTRTSIGGDDNYFLYPDMSFDYGVGNESLYVYSYIGPIDTKHLSDSKTDHLVQLFGFGWFIIGYLAKLILWLLTSLYVFIPNYGIICI